MYLLPGENVPLSVDIVHTTRNVTVNCLGLKYLLLLYNTAPEKFET